MRQKIGIIIVKNSFSDKIIENIDRKKFKIITYKKYTDVDYEKLDQFDYFIWHFEPENKEKALGLFTTLAMLGVHTFPDLRSLILFDNKIYQSNLLKALKVSMPDYKVFYRLKDCLEDAKDQSLPVVFKLKGGASSNNVFLVQSKVVLFLRSLRMFTVGYDQVSKINNLSNLTKKYLDGRVGLLKVFKGVVRLFIKTKRDRILGKEFGYFYLQEFLPNNNNDVRIIVIGDKCFGFTRYNRMNDFRASGSGRSSFSKDLISKDLIENSFVIYRKLKMRSVAFDYLVKEDCPTLIEISYGFIKNLYENCEGYWTEDLQWHDKKVRPELFIVEELLECR